MGNKMKIRLTQSMISMFVFASLVMMTSPLNAHTDTETVNMTFQVVPVTVVKAVSTSGHTGIDFGSVVPGGVAFSRELDVSILTNSNDPYHVYHEIRNEVLSAGGTPYPEDDLFFTVSNGQEHGSSEVASPTQIPRGRSVIFSSGSQGGYDRFRIQYSIANEKLSEAGDYYGQVYIDVEPY